MTVYSDLRTAVVAVLNGVADVGVVHNRPRFNADTSTFLNQFRCTVNGSQVIRGWMVLREAAPHREELDVFGRVTRVHMFVLIGIQGFQDTADSYGSFQALCDSVMAAFDDETNLSVTGVTVNAVGPCSLRAFEEQQIGSPICHIAEIEVPIEVSLAAGVA